MSTPSISSEELLGREVSFQDSAFGTPSKECRLGEVLNDIRNGTYAAQVQHLRDLLASGNREQYSVDKRRLPGVTFSGTFHLQRRIVDLKEYNSTVVLDIDHVSGPDLIAVIEKLRSDPHVFASWVSPSEEGVKGLVPLSFADPLRSVEAHILHRAAFLCLSDYFSQAYGLSLDRSGSDVTRLCFLSSDPDLFLRDAVMPFAIDSVPGPFLAKRSGGRAYTANNAAAKPEDVKRCLCETEGKNSPRDRRTIASIIKFLEKRQLSITGSYDKWVHVALAIAGAFTYDIGKKYFLRLCRLDQSAHDEDASIRLLESCYLTGRREISLGTVWHYAEEVGYKCKECDEGQY